MNQDKSNSISEQRLLELLKEDSLAAFDEIFNRYRDRLFLSTSNILNDREVAEGVVQEIFVNLWERRKVVQIEKLSGYLFQAGLPTQYEDEVELGTTVADFDRYEDSRTTVDITGAYTFPLRKVKILAQARNLSNEPEAAYQGSESRYDRHTLVGRTYFLGLSLKF